MHQENLKVDGYTEENWQLFCFGAIISRFWAYFAQCTSVFYVFSYKHSPIIDIEHGSFTPVVTSAYGGFGRESGKFISELVNKLSLKLDLPTSVVANYVRSKISFELVRSQVMCLRGARTKRKLNVEVGEMQVQVVNCVSRMPQG